MNLDVPPHLGRESAAKAETRREFLIRLAKSTAFVPPLILTHEPVWAQGTQPPGQISKIKRNPAAAATPTADPSLQTTTTTTPGVPETSTYGAPAPWTRPPQP